MILNLICILFFLIFGILFISLAYNPDYFLSLINNFILEKKFIFNLRVQFASIGVIFILFALKIFGIFFGFRKEKVIKLNTKEGELVIFISAIEDIITRLLNSKKELTHIRPQVKMVKKNIDIVIKGNLTSEINILDFVSDAQREIKERLNNILGDKEIKIKFEIRKISVGKNKPTIEEVQIPFRNY